MTVFTRPGRRRKCIERAEKSGAMVWPVTIDFTGVTSWTQEASSAQELPQIRERT